MPPSTTIYNASTGELVSMHPLDAARAIRQGGYVLTEPPGPGAPSDTMMLDALQRFLTRGLMDTGELARYIQGVVAQSVCDAHCMGQEYANGLLAQMQEAHAHVLMTDTPVNAVAATLTTALTGTNNDMIYTAAVRGVVGNSTTIAYVDPAAASQSLSITVVGQAITVHLATSGGSAITSTAADIKAAIDADADAHALVTVANAGGNDGTGVVIALAATPLTGGIDGTLGTAGQERYDATYRYSCLADNGTDGQHWVRVAWPAAY